LPPAIQPSLEETLRLETDEIDDQVLRGRLLDVLQRLCRILRRQRRVCAGLSLTIRYSDQVEVTKRERVSPETCWDMDLAPVLVSLFHRCFQRRIRLRLLTVQLSDLAALAQQGSLFDARSLDEQRRQERAKDLALAIDELHDRFGEQAIRYGRSP
jgi:DNA polymerase-4